MSPASRAQPTATWLFGTVRAVTVLLAVMALIQAVLAGSFLDGHAESLDPHMMIGMAMVAVAMLLAGLSGIGIMQGLPRRMFFTAVLFVVVLAAQVYAGTAGLVGLHVPLGVLLVTGITMQAIQVFRPPRPRSDATVRVSTSD